MSAAHLPIAVVEGERTVGRDELAADVVAAAAALSARGVGPDDPVILSLPNSYEFVVAHLALDRLGAITVNLPTTLRREVGQVVRMVDAKLAIFEALDDPRRYGDLRETLTLDVGDALLDADAGGPQEHEHAPDDRTWLAFTSGSTGTPRAAVHTRRSLAASTGAMARRYELGPDDSVLVAAPVGHAIGFCYGVRLAADCGARLVLQRRWDPAGAVELIDRERCSFAAIPTPFLWDLVRADRRPREGTLRQLIVGGAPVPSEHVLEAERVFGQGIVSSYYGASECGAVLSSPPGVSAEQRARTDGVPMIGVEVRIAGPDGEDVPGGETGELVVRGDQVALGYWSNNDSDDQFRRDGWFHTRDLARSDADGFVSVTGRIKDVIFRGAINVAPREVEEAVASHPRVGFTVAVGCPDERLGERIVVVATADESAPTLDEVRDWLAEVGLARSKWPDEITFVEEMPRAESGKIDRQRVRAALQESQRSA